MSLNIEKLTRLIYEKNKHHHPTVPLQIKDYSQQIQGYSTAQLAKMLRLATFESFPSIIESDAAKNLLYNYYSTHYEIKLPHQTKFNDEQMEIINNQVTTPQIALVNAGPGSGKTCVLLELCRQLAKKMPDKSVIYISYTNKAINEPHTRIQQFPGKISAGVKKWLHDKHDILFHTIDSLAYKIKTEFNVASVNTANYDASIRQCINLLRTSNCPTLTSIGHIIIDEAQDIDDLRIELVFLLAQRYNIPLTICGDPRQRLSTAGTWFVNLWQGKCPHYIDTPMQSKIKKYGLTESYRFKNASVLYIVNKMSRLRPSLHVELSSSTIITGPENQEISKIDCYLTTSDDEEDNMKALILELKREMSQPNDILVCGISVDKQNMTTVYIQKFYTVMKSAGIDCFWDNSTAPENFKPRGVRFSTCHSTKGSEANIVVLVGPTPDKFPHIEKEISDSINFVSCSRSKSKLIFLCNAFGYRPPRGIDMDDLNFKTGRPIEAKENSTINGLYKISDIAIHRGYDTFVTTNELIYNRNTSVMKDYIPIIKPNGIAPDVWGIIFHTVVQIFLVGRLPKNLLDFIAGNFVYVDGSIFKKYRNDNVLVNGRLIQNHDGYEKNTLVLNKDSINTPSDAELTSCRKICGKNLDEVNFVELTQIVAINFWLINECMRLRYDAVFDVDIDVALFKNIANIITHQFGTCLDVESPTLYNHTLIGSIDAVFDDSIIELKAVSELTDAHIHQLVLYGTSKNKLDGRMPKMYLFNLTNGEWVHVELANLKRFDYCLSKFLKLHHHVNNTVKYSQSSSPVEVPSNYYIVDTEYIPAMGGQQDKIFEIALVCIEHPYRSIVALIETEAENIAQAVEWLNDHSNEDEQINESYFTGALQLRDVERILMNNCKIYNPNVICTLAYYNAKTDVNWVVADVATVDLAIPAKNIAFEKGSSITAGVLVNLSSFYDAFGACPIISRLYLNEHTALSDCLFLYELIKIGVKLV